MTPATARDYPQLVRALKARRVALGLTRDDVDHIGGLPKKFTERLEGGKGLLSDATLSRLLAALACRLYIATRAGQ
jgi:predicted transcriptional regulator